jgi:hypothetical protein
LSAAGLVGRVCLTWFTIEFRLDVDSTDVTGGKDTIVLEAQQ